MRSARLVAAILLLGIRAWAAVPTLDHVHPVALLAGTTNTLTVLGKFDPWPPKIWVDTPGISFTAETNSGKFSVILATNAPVGPHFLRAFNDLGASGPRLLVVTRNAPGAEQEPNDDFTRPQSVERLPAAINGCLEKSGDVDSFAVALAEGQTLIAAVEAYTLASPLDAVLRVVDSRGVPMAFNHDDGRTLDPFLAWTAPAAGTYVVQVFGFAYPADSSVRFTGSKSCVYRLHLSRGPYAWHTVPLGVQRGARMMLSLAGWNLGAEPVQSVPFDGTEIGAELTSIRLTAECFDNELLLPVGDGMEWLEPPPADATNDLRVLEPPCAVTGCIAKAGEEDRFRFMAKKGDMLVLRVQSAAFGFPLDARLRVEDKKGKELAKNDDSGSADPSLEWTAPEDGTNVAVVSGVLHRGGPDHLYRLSFERPTPSVKAVVTEHAFTIEPGQTNEVKLTVTRLHGLTNKLAVSMRDLPEGVTSQPVEVPEKGGAVTLKLISSSQAKPFTGPIQIIVRQAESGEEHPAIHELISSSFNNGVPNGYSRLLLDTIDRLWLTVLPVPVAKKSDKGK